MIERYEIKVRKREYNDYLVLLSSLWIMRYDKYNPSEEFVRIVNQFHSQKENW